MFLHFSRLLRLTIVIPTLKNKRKIFDSYEITCNDEANFLHLAKEQVCRKVKLKSKLVDQTSIAKHFLLISFIVYVQQLLLCRKSFA